VGDFMKERLKNLLEGQLKEAFLELKNGSMVHLVINDELYKVAKINAKIMLMPPSENDKPLLIFKINKDIISSIEEAKEDIKDVLRKLYLRGDIHVNVSAPTSILLACGATSMLRKMGLTSPRR